MARCVTLDITGFRVCGKWRGINWSEIVPHLITTCIWTSSCKWVTAMLISLAVINSIKIWAVYVLSFAVELLELCHVILTSHDQLHHQFNHRVNGWRLSEHVKKWTDRFLFIVLDRKSVLHLFLCSATLIVLCLVDRNTVKPVVRGPFHFTQILFVQNNENRYVL